MEDEKYKITQRDLENPQRFVGEGLGAPEAKIKMEAKAQKRAEGVHCC